MNPPANTPIIPHVESGGVTNPTVKVESGGVTNPTINMGSGGMPNPTINPPAKVESGVVAIPKVDKDGGNALINDYSVPVIEIKPTKKRRYGCGTSGDTVTKSCTCCPDDEYESDYYDK